MTKKRPKCRRCGGDLDLWIDPETGIQLICNNPKVLSDDKTFFKMWNSLDGDVVARLERIIYEDAAVS